MGEPELPITDDAGLGGDPACERYHMEAVIIEVTYNDGLTWFLLWEGNVRVCDT